MVRTWTKGKVYTLVIVAILSISKKLCDDENTCYLPVLVPIVMLVGKVVEPEKQRHYHSISFKHQHGAYDVQSYYCEKGVSF